MPKWTSSERQAHLVRLWVTFGNRCLQGHTTCPNPEHYIHYKPKAVTFPIPVLVPCQDRDGNPLKDKDGNRLYLTIYQTGKGIVYKATVCRLYDLQSKRMIAFWASEDREARNFLLRLQRQTLHRICERGSLRGRFNAISRTIYADNQPQFYFEAIGISGLTFKPFAKVRLASSFLHLHIELGDTLKAISKNKRRKAIRYGKALPIPVQKQVDSLCAKAVTKYLS